MLLESKRCYKQNPLFEGGRIETGTLRLQRLVGGVSLEQVVDAALGDDRLAAEPEAQIGNFPISIGCRSYLYSVPMPASRNIAYCPRSWPTQVGSSRRIHSWALVGRRDFVNGLKRQRLSSESVGKP
jgi:hypothetical protein